MLDTTATGEIVTELMRISNINSFDGMTVGLLNSYDDKNYYDSFTLGETYYGVGFELTVDYDETGKVLYSHFTSV